MSRRDRPLSRMQPDSTFGNILERFVRAIPGCYGAVFVDQEGEAVDAVGWASAFDVQVTGAHFCVVLAEAGILPGGPLHEMVVVAKRGSYRVRMLPEGYALVLLFHRDAAFHVSQRVLRSCEAALSREAGFPLNAGEPVWWQVEVHSHGSRNGRPRRARGQTHWHEVEVLGAIVGLGARETGFRVRLANGAEITLLREPLGRWWSDQPLE